GPAQRGIRRALCLGGRDVGTRSPVGGDERTELVVAGPAPVVCFVLFLAHPAIVPRLHAAPWPDSATVASCRRPAPSFIRHDPPGLPAGPCVTGPSARCEAVAHPPTRSACGRGRTASTNERP